MRRVERQHKSAAMTDSCGADSAVGATAAGSGRAHRLPAPFQWLGLSGSARQRRAPAGYQGRVEQVTPVVAFCVTTTWPSTAISQCSCGRLPEPQSGQ